MSTINETVRTTLQQNGYGSYMQYAAPVIAALEDRERGIVTQLVTWYVNEADGAENEAREALSEAGLTMPAPEPEPEPVAAASNGEGEPEWVGRLIQRIETLEQVARSRGLI